MVAPSPDRKFEGILTIAAEYSAVARPAQDTSRAPGEDGPILARLLEKTIRRSGAIDVESLCIVAGTVCFALRADVCVLHDDGGVVTAASVALVAALAHFRRPDFAVEGNGRVRVFSEHERQPVPLSMLHHPFCACFSVVELPKRIILVDGTAAEEQVGSSQVIFALNRHGEVCQIVKYGGVPIDRQLLIQCMALATQAVQTWSTLLAQALRDDTIKRNVGGLATELAAEIEL